MVLMARPAVLFLLAMYAALGMAQAGRSEDPVLLGRVLVVVIGFLLFSVACNDLADEAIDRANLASNANRPLVVGSTNRRELLAIGVTSAVVALAVSATLHWAAVVVTVVGLAISANYSFRPIRLADRGAVASLVLPACYVAVPYLLGVFAARSFVRVADLTLLAALYVGFIGRILLKDFRDVRGDAMFGKRTFLVRYGRRWTCLFSAVFWTTGSLALVAAVQQRTLALTAAVLLGLVGVLWLLAELSVDRGPRRDELLVAATAIIGRGTLVVVLAHFAMTQAGWQWLPYLAVLGALLALTAAQAVSMVRYGPRRRVQLCTLNDRPASMEDRVHANPGSGGGGLRPRTSGR